MTLEIVLDSRVSPKSPMNGELDAENLTFGTCFSPHMFTVRYDQGEGWHDATLEPYGPLNLEPTALCLHYAQEVFEGLKAYSRSGGDVGLFRPQANAKRFNASCRRVCIPDFDEALFVKGIEALVDLDRAWVPTVPGSALYVRPAVIATEPALGLRISRQYLFFIVTSPVGPYFGSFQPIRICTVPKYTRAAPGGMGAAKTAGNYAAGLLPAREATEQGYQQVLYLDAQEKRYIEELGGMNVFIRKGRKLLTPALTGTILAGITRDSLMTLARDHGYEVEEAMISIDTLMSEVRSGEVQEIFACGTAAVATPIGVLTHEGEELTIGDGQAGEATRALFEALTDIQYGRATDTHGWAPIVERSLEPLLSS